ncbi:MAG: T9SS type A sorting domain-containing protein [Candidatus Latescibacterota bacterium]|nr:MAG: T9SS type A sorting domain-containing protein [Candidatus Latescibacterota bacterium]
MRARSRLLPVLFSILIALLITSDAYTRNPIRNAFFNVYPGAEGSRLDDLPSNAGHCGLCHYDFDGGGTRNWYGAAVEVARQSAGTDEEAISVVALFDQDNDGYLSETEITDLVNFANTPTFPGLAAGDTNLVANVDLSDIRDYLTPSGSTDTTPPDVTVLTPAGGENWNALSTHSVTWTATDASGIAHVDIYHSDDNGMTFKQVGMNEPNDGSFDWFVPNRPGVSNIIRVVARDNPGNYGSNWSASFSITGTLGGLAPTTMRDMDLPGSQPFEARTFEDPDANCKTCHGEYNYLVEPWYQWKGSMMGQAMRDPLFLACVAIAEQDAPSVGDLCLRCHSPGGWLEGRSVDTGGGLMTAKDRQGIHCDFCHRAVDPIYEAGISPAEDQAVLDSLSTGPPLVSANGQFVADPAPIRRGPYDDAIASHAFLESPYHREADICGTCHDVSNPVYVAGATPGDYVLNSFDTPHPDGDLRNMFPIERTYSEWTETAYAKGGVFAPQFAGAKPDGIVSTCQDCHMRDIAGKGCSEPGSPSRSDLPLHDLTGGNHFIGDILPSFFPTEVDSAHLNAAKQRAISMLQLAATMALATGQVSNQPTVTVTITNETGHKLPSGYPEGRRIWLNLKAYDSENNLIYESGVYDPVTGVLTKDADIKVYEIKPGLSPALGTALGLPAGESFHFVVNDTVYSDNRIPPRGFTNASFETIQSPPVAYAYADSQYWDETTYLLPAEAVFAEATLYYQTVSKEYIEFLRDENVTNTAGLDLYNAWVAQGRCAPVAMVSDFTNIEIDPSGIGDIPRMETALYQNAPNPFNPSTTIRYSLSERQRVTIQVYDVAGRLVRTLVDDERPAGVQKVQWHGVNDHGERVASGVYFFVMRANGFKDVKKAVFLK